MEDILSLMNFDEGIALPIANEDNKKLESAIETRQREISKLRDDVDRFASRIQSMTDHLKNVRQERLQTQELCNAREREIKTEEHFRQLAEREEGRLKSEIKRLEKEISENKESKNTYENNIFKGVQRIESMKVQMDWDQNALEAWLKESAKQDEDSMILHKYAKDDEGKIKQLSLVQEKLIEDRAQRRKSLENEITRTLTSQLELDKVSETFREAHIVRQELLKQWESTIEQMRKRDTEMNDASLQLMELKFQLKTQHDLLKEQQQFLENELNNNNEKGKKISASERQGAKLRLTYQDAENTRIQYQDELETLKYTVDRTAKDLDNARKEVNELKMEIAARKEKLDNSRQMNDELGEQLRWAENTQMTAEERAHMLENKCKKEEQNVAVIEKNLAKLRDVQFKKTQELYQINQTEGNLNVEIQGAKAASRNLSSKINKLDVESLKQQEIVYNQDFQIQQLERKITRLQGERTNDEKIQLEKRIKEMSGVLEGHQTKHTMLTSQLKKLDDDLRRANRDLEKCSEEDKALDNKIGELNLYNESSERELKKVTLGKQQLMVEENIHKLEIKRLRDQLHGRANQVLSLEEKRLLLDTAMKERRQEINIHNAMLKAQIKSDEEERQSISMELHERISKIEKLRKRYEILMISMAPPEGEEERSQAYYVIKAAQEKEELQRKGDDLNAKIRKAEKEIMALENTLRLMDSRNETFRKSHAVVNETSEEYEEKLRLEETYRVAQDKSKYKRRRLKELEEDLTVMRQTADGLSTEELQVKSLLEEKSRFRDTILKEIDGQEKKRDRANKTVNRLTGECRSARKTKQALPEEQDINVRAMKELNRNVLKKFAEVLSEQSDIVPIVNMYLEEAGISMPTPSPSQSSRASSVGSFRSNLSSSRSSVASVDQGKREVLGTASLDLMDSFGAQNTPASVQRGASASRKSTPTHSRPQSRHSPTKSSPTKRTPSREGRVLPGAQGSSSRMSTASSTRSSGRKT